MKAWIGDAIALVTLIAPLCAQAAAPTAQLSVSVSGNGQVMSDPGGISCPTDCVESYKRGSTVTLTATAANNSNFSGWSGACAGTTPTCVISRLTTPTLVTATFMGQVTPPPAPVGKTGITTCYGVNHEVVPCAGTGQDGEFRAGASVSPPRFVKNTDGTVDDRLTGIRWTAKSCGAFRWDDAVSYVAALGHGACGLSDGSQAGDWRVPNILELLTLLNWQDAAIHECAIADANGTACLSSGTWSSTPDLVDPSFYRVEFWRAGIAALGRSTYQNVVAVKK